jgi:hypothetical protein
VRSDDTSLTFTDRTSLTVSGLPRHLAGWARR